MRLITLICIALFVISCDKEVNIEYHGLTKKVEILNDNGVLLYSQEVPDALNGEKYNSAYSRTITSTTKVVFDDDICTISKVLILKDGTREYTYSINIEDGGTY